MRLLGGSAEALPGVSPGGVVLGAALGSGRLAYRVVVGAVDDRRGAQLGAAAEVHCCLPEPRQTGQVTMLSRWTPFSVLVSRMVRAPWQRAQARGFTVTGAHPRTGPGRR